MPPMHQINDLVAEIRFRLATYHVTPIGPNRRHHETRTAAEWAGSPVSIITANSTPAGTPIVRPTRRTLACFARFAATRLTD